MHPIITLVDETEPRDPRLTEPLAAQYGGDLSFPAPAAQGARPYVYANFVSSLDGVVSYAMPGHTSGGEISGDSDADRFIMGLLRACADAVVFGAGTLAGESGQVRTPDAICPEVAEEYAALRAAMGKRPQPLNVVLSDSGKIDLSEPIFHTSGLEALVFTTEAGRKVLEAREPPPALHIHVAEGKDCVDVRQVLTVLNREWRVRLCLLEGGPRVLGSFLEAEALDELFLTLSPRIAGRDQEHPRPGLEQAVAFGPDSSPHVVLKSLKRQGSYLFCRYVVLRDPGG